MHAWQRYDEALKALPKAVQSKSLDYLALKQMQVIYREEMKLQELEPDERLRIRQVVIKLLVKAYFTWVRQKFRERPTKDQDLERSQLFPESGKLPESIS